MNQRIVEGHSDTDCAAETKAHETKHHKKKTGAGSGGASGSATKPAGGPVTGDTIYKCKGNSGSNNKHDIDCSKIKGKPHVNIHPIPTYKMNSSTTEAQKQGVCCELSQKSGGLPVVNPAGGATSGACFGGNKAWSALSNTEKTDCISTLPAIHTLKKVDPKDTSQANFQWEKLSKGKLNGSCQRPGTSCWFPPCPEGRRDYDSTKYTRGCSLNVLPGKTLGTCFIRGFAAKQGSTETECDALAKKGVCADAPASTDGSVPDSFKKCEGTGH